MQNKKYVNSHSPFHGPREGHRSSECSMRPSSRQHRSWHRIRFCPVMSIQNYCVNQAHRAYSRERTTYGKPDVPRHKACDFHCYLFFLVLLLQLGKRHNQWCFVCPRHSVFALYTMRGYYKAPRPQKKPNIQNNESTKLFHSLMLLFLNGIAQHNESEPIRARKPTTTSS